MRGNVSCSARAKGSNRRELLGDSRLNAAIQGADRNLNNIVPTAEELTGTAGDQQERQNGDESVKRIARWN
jgi:hypothetical protein